MTAADNLVSAGRPTLDDWLAPENRAWGFQHVRELVPTVRIPAASNPRPLEEKLVDLDDVQVAGMGLTLGEYLNLSATGFLVMQSGTIRYERYLRGLTPRSPHLLMSISKSVVASVTGVLVGLGHLDPSAAVCELLPQLHGTAWDGCTLQHLLDMRGGIQFDESDEDPGSDLFVYEQIYQWRPLWQDLPTDIRDYMAALPADRAHGGGFRYQSILTDMLGWVLEAVTGQRLSDLIAELLWVPMGAETDAEITVDRHGNAHADGGMSACLRDVGRLGELWREGGAWGDSEIVPRGWIERTLSPAWASAIEESSNGRQRNGYYSQNWWIVDPERGVYAARGYCGQALYVDMDAEVVAVLFSAWPKHTAEQEEGVVDVVRAVSAALG